MKILWHSNAPWAATGYGQQTRIFAPLIRDMGVDIAISCAYGLNGSESAWNGIRLLPAGYDAYGNDIISSHAMEHLKSPHNGWLGILYDAWVYQAPTIGNFHTFVWCPVDHDPAPPSVLQFFRRFNAVPIAMSRFGVDKFAEQGVEALYVPHGVDGFFEPKDKTDARDALGLPTDAFVVGMNMANKGGELHRKAYDAQLQAFAQFATQHDDAFLYLHTEQFGHGRGWNLDNLTHALGVADRVKFVDQYTYRLGVPPEAMPWLYSAFDVLMNATMGEGFGIPIVEAQACGTPVIVSDWTAMPELCGAGWKVPGQRFWHEHQQSWWINPDVEALVDALEKARSSVGRLSRRAVEFAAQYRAEVVARDFWFPVLENLRERIDPAPLEWAA